MHSTATGGRILAVQKGKDDRIVPHDVDFHENLCGKEEESLSSAAVIKVESCLVVWIYSSDNSAWHGVNAIVLYTGKC